MLTGTDGAGAPGGRGGGGVQAGGSLAIDAGQSGIKVRHADAAGASEWAGPGIRTDLPLLPQLARVIEQSLEQDRAATTVGLGVSGLTDDVADAGYLLAAAAAFGVRSVHLAHDSITAYLGALGDERGAVVASGTGVVTLAVGADEVARVDGWGYLIGDAGSGYWLGRAALDAVMRAHDGRGEPTALTAVVAADFPDLERAYIDLQSDPERVGRIATYARPVADLAETDAVAAAIVEAAGRELAASVVAGLRRVGEADAAAPRVRGIGGVFGGAVLARAFTAAVLEQVPTADVRIGEAHPLDGAAALAGVDPTSALAVHIATASSAG
jgi:N-acetylglucosamine kinase-like BadF-type ATPase